MAGGLPRVVIVGAGISGLAAAERLYRHGVTDITILEATEHVGGRIHTKWIDTGSQRYKVELGANWIHGVHDNILMKYAKKHKLNTLDDDDDSITEEWLAAIDSNGQEISKDLVDDVVERIEAILEKACTYFHGTSTLERDVGMRDYVFSELEHYLSSFQGDDRKLRETIVNHRLSYESGVSGCHDLNEVSAQQFGSYKELDGAHRILKDGYEQLIQVFQKHIPNDMIKLNHIVRELHVLDRTKNALQITQNDEVNDDCDFHEDDKGSYVEIRCTNGVILKSDIVIWTTSLGHLKENADTTFKPSLPKEKLEAIAKLGFGIVNKAFLEFDDLQFLGDKEEIRFFDHDYDPNCTEYAQNWLHRVGDSYIESYAFPDGKEKVLTFWLLGEQGKYTEQLSDEEVQSGLMSRLKSFLKTDVPRPRRIIRTQWHSNPYTRGSYSFVAVNSTVDHIRALADPITDQVTHKPLLLFAGEATHELFYSTVHGALLSGQREADRILAAYPALNTPSGGPAKCVSS